MRSVVNLAGLMAAVRVKLMSTAVEVPAHRRQVKDHIKWQFAQLPLRCSCFSRAGITAGFQFLIDSLRNNV